MSKCKTCGGKVLCPYCGSVLRKVTYPGGYLNAEQWESIRAGDYFCEVCPPSERQNVRYLWAEEVVCCPDCLEKDPCTCDRLEAAEKNWEELQADCLAIRDAGCEANKKVRQQAKEIERLRKAIKYISSWLESGTRKGRPMDLMTKEEWAKWQALSEIGDESCEK